MDRYNQFAFSEEGGFKIEENLEQYSDLKYLNHSFKKIIIDPKERIYCDFFLNGCITCCFGLKEGGIIGGTDQFKGIRILNIGFFPLIKKNISIFPQFRRERLFKHYPEFIKWAGYEFEQNGFTFLL